MIEWHFEHFKTFTPYDIMQPAAAALLLCEGESTDGSNPKMAKLTKLLIEQTGHPTWVPTRDTGNLDIDTEGSVFRNKARLFSSFYICVPPDLLQQNSEPKTIVMTNFGRALGLGYVSEEAYYEFIIKRFQYPHPAFSNYEEWVQSGIVIRPFIFILKVLVALFESYGSSQAFLTAKEVYNCLQAQKKEDVQTVIEELTSVREGKQQLADADTRKINEILSFLAISGYLYVDSTRKDGDYFYLNLVKRHPLEKVHFFFERTAGGAGTGQRKEKYNVIHNIKKLWEE